MPGIVAGISIFAVFCFDCAFSTGVPVAVSCASLGRDTCESKQTAASDYSHGLFQRSAFVPRKALIARSPNDSVEFSLRNVPESEDSQTTFSIVSTPSIIQHTWSQLQDLLHGNSTSLVPKLGVIVLIGVVVFASIALLISCGLSCWSWFDPKQTEPEAIVDELARLEVARQAVLAKLDTIDTELCSMYHEVAGAEVGEPVNAEGTVEPIRSAAVSDNVAGSSSPSDAAIRASASSLLAQTGDGISSLQSLRVMDVGEKAEELRVGVTEAIEGARASAEALARQTASTTAEALQEALVADVPQEEVAEIRHTIREAVAPLLGMPVPLLFAGLIAPLQLQALCSWSWLMAGLQLPTVALLATAAAVDFGKPCGGKAELWIWSLGTLAISGATLALRCRVLYRARLAMDDVRDHRNPSGSHGHAFQHQHHLKDIIEVVSMSSTEYFRALLAYDGIAQAWLYTVINVLSCLSLLWGFSGVAYMVLGHTLFLGPEHCEATTMRLAAHVMGFAYIAFMFWIIASIACWAIMSALSSDRVAMSVLRTATTFDDTYSHSSLPVASILLRGTLLRNARDTMALESSTLCSDLQELRREKSALDAQERTLGVDLVDAEQRLLASERRMEKQRCLADVAESCSQQIAYALDGAAIVAMAAATGGEAHAAELLADARSTLSDVGSRTAQRAEETISSSRVGEVAGAAMDAAQRSPSDLADAARQQFSNAGLDASHAQQAIGDFALQVLTQAESLGVDVRELAEAVALSRTPRSNGAAAAGEAVPGG